MGANNWEALASFIQQYPDISIGDNILTNNHNLNVKIFVNQLSLHTLTQVVDRLGESRLKSSVKLSELDKHLVSLQVEERKLEEKLKAIRSTVIEVNHEHEVTKKQLYEETIRLDQVKSNYDKIEQFINKHEPRFKKWKERLQADINNWTNDDVTMLLNEIGLNKYVNTFSENRIDGNALAALTTQDLIQSLDLTFKEAKLILKSIFLIQKYKDIYMTPPSVLQWNTDIVCVWLEDNKLAHLTDAFRKCQVKH
jgi:hypothetical protein